MADSIPTVVLVHTVPMLVETFNLYGREILPGVRLKHVLDEPLLQRIRERGRIAAPDAARLQTHVDLAQEIGAAAVLVTCSTVSPVVDDLSTQIKIPVVKIDEAMLARALDAGPRIGAIATLTTTLEPTRQALFAHTVRESRVVEVEMVFVPDAFAALSQGDGETHDALVKAAILELASRVDVIVLAQASMARVLDSLAPGESSVPVLASPQTALYRVRDLMQWH